MFEKIFDYFREANFLIGVVVISLWTGKFLAIFLLMFTIVGATFHLLLFSVQTLLYENEEYKITVSSPSRNVKGDEHIFGNDACSKPLFCKSQGTYSEGSAAN